MLNDFLICLHSIPHIYSRQNIVDIDSKKNQVHLKCLEEPKAPPKQFTFDGAYGLDSITETIYNDVGFPLVESVITIIHIYSSPSFLSFFLSFFLVFAYLVTLCRYIYIGVRGLQRHSVCIRSDRLRQVVHHAGHQRRPGTKGHDTESVRSNNRLRSQCLHFERRNNHFKQKQQQQKKHIFEAVAIDTTKKYLIRAAYLEIYNENIRDLLGKDYKNTLDLHEHPDKGVYVSQLSWNECKTIGTCEKLMEKGNRNRSTGATLMNADSSRSHSMFTICVEMCETDEQGEEHYKIGKLNLVDLAGSERQSKTGATGDRLKEATKINLSLSALGNVISALVDGKSKHIPYRDSKLTRLLQDSLGGNTKTLMIAALSPAGDNYEETLSTLRYANRAKSIKNKPTINEDPKDAMLRQLQEEINLLKAQLAGQVPLNSSAAIEGGGGGGKHASSSGSSSFKHHDQIEEEKRKLRDEYEEKIREIEGQYEEEKMSKEALMKKMDAIKAQYDYQMGSLDGGSNAVSSSTMKPPKSSRMNRKQSSAKKMSSDDLSNAEQMAGVNGTTTDADGNALNTEMRGDPRERLLKLQELMVGGEQANNEELKKRRIKKKKHAEERKQLLAQSLRNGDDDEFMLRIYDSVQEEVMYKTRQLDKEKEKVEFLENEVSDLQHEFETEREEYLDMIRKQERQLKLLSKLNHKLHSITPHDCNYYNLDKIQAAAIWNEEHQDWLLPELKREKLSLPAMNYGESELDISIMAQSIGNNNNDPVTATAATLFHNANANNNNIINAHSNNISNGATNGAYMSSNNNTNNSHNGYMMNGGGALDMSALSGTMPLNDIVPSHHQYQQQMNGRQAAFFQKKEPEIDRYRMKLENSQFDSTTYFKNKRQTELLSQTQDMKNLGPLNNLRNKNF